MEAPTYAPTPLRKVSQPTDHVFNDGEYNGVTLTGCLLSIINRIIDLRQVLPPQDKM